MGGNYQGHKICLSLFNLIEEHPDGSKQYCVTYSHSMDLSGRVGIFVIGSFANTNLFDVLADSYIVKTSKGTIFFIQGSYQHHGAPCMALSLTYFQRKKVCLTLLARLVSKVILAFLTTALAMYCFHSLYK